MSFTKKGFILAAVLLLCQAGCLKTRSQIKGEAGDSGAQSENGEEGANGANAGANGGYKMEEFRNELTRVSGKLDELEHQAKTQNVGDVKEYATRLESRIQDLEKNQLLVLSELKDLKDRAQVPIATHERSGKANGSRLNEGFVLLKSKEYEEAAEIFRGILSRNPKGKDAAEAYFGLGEAEYGQNGFKKAIVAYSKVQELQPKSPRLPAALYKIALSFEHLNMRKEAHGFFAELLERFPSAPEAKKAKGRLK